MPQSAGDLLLEQNVGLGRRMCQMEVAQETCDEVGGASIWTVARARRRLHVDRHATYWDVVSVSAALPSLC
eukprot:8019890-Pyramimonas_sp.AAC.1